MAARATLPGATSGKAEEMDEIIREAPGSDRK